MLEGKDKLNRSRIIIGSLMALLSAITFAFNLVLASLSYQYGANIHALNLGRASVFLVCLGIAVIANNSTLKMPAKARLVCFMVGFLLCLEMYSLLGAIQTVPVALAILIFYTYPILIAVYRWLRRSDAFSILSLVLLLAAFVGLGIVLIDAPVQLDTTGVGLSVIAAAAMATMLIVSERSLNHYDNFVVLTHALLVVTCVVILLSTTLVELHWPQIPIGWLIYAGSTVFYVVATFSLFKAVSMIGPLKTAIIDNTSPIWAIVFGFYLLQENLSYSQQAGAALVIIAVMLLQWSKSGRALADKQGCNTC